MENASIFGALWVPQSKLHSRGEKELDAYFGRQLLFSSLWRAILNVAEVGASPVFHAEEQFYYQEFSPLMLSQCDISSMSDTMGECCICHAENSVMPSLPTHV